MPLRLYRRVSLIPGVRLNASRAGLSVSLGHRGHGTRYARMAAELAPTAGQPAQLGVRLLDGAAAQGLWVRRPALH